MIQIDIKKLIQTCMACPSQWEGYDEKGFPIYIRYRWGYLSIRRGKQKSIDIDDAVSGEEIFSKGLGDGYDGVIDLSIIIQESKDKINWI